MMGRALAPACIASGWSMAVPMRPKIRAVYLGTAVIPELLT